MCVKQFCRGSHETAAHKVSHLNNGRDNLIIQGAKKPFTYFMRAMERRNVALGCRCEVRYDFHSLFVKNKGLNTPNQHIGTSGDENLDPKKLKLELNVSCTDWLS